MGIEKEKDGGNSDYVEGLKLIKSLDFFLVTAPVNWHENQIIRRYYLNKEEGFVSCVYWNNLYFLTGTDIVRCIAYKMHHLGRKIVDRKKFEEGIFSDLRALKSGTHAVLEEARSPFLKFLHKNQCIRTQKKQKVFFLFSIPHHKLFSDVLERDLKREVSNQPATTIAIHPIMKSFKYDQSSIPVLGQYADHVKEITGTFVNHLLLKPSSESDQISPEVVKNEFNNLPSQPSPLQLQQFALASARDESLFMNLFDSDSNQMGGLNSMSYFDHAQQQPFSMTPKYMMGNNGVYQMVSPVYSGFQQQPLDSLNHQDIKNNNGIFNGNDKNGYDGPQIVSAGFTNNYFTIPAEFTPFSKTPQIGLVPQDNNNQSYLLPNGNGLPRLPSLASANFTHMIPLVISPGTMLNNELQALEANKAGVLDDKIKANAEGNDSQQNNDLNSRSQSTLNLVSLSGVPGEFNSLNSATFNQFFPSGTIEDFNTTNQLNTASNGNGVVLGQLFTPGALSFFENNGVPNSNINNGFSPLVGFKNGLLNEIHNKIADTGKITKPSKSKNSSKKLLNPVLRHLDINSVYDDGDSEQQNISDPLTSPVVKIE